MWSPSGGLRALEERERVQEPGLLARFGAVEVFVLKFHAHRAVITRLFQDREDLRPPRAAVAGDRVAPDEFSKPVRLGEGAALVTAQLVERVVDELRVFRVDVPDA